MMDGRRRFMRRRRRATKMDLIFLSEIADLVGSMEPGVMPPILAMANTTPIELEFFVELLQIATEAFEGKRRELPPMAERCIEDSPPGAIYFTDAPENQAMFAVKRTCEDRFGEDGRAIATSFHFRRFAISQAVDEGRIKVTDRGVHVSFVRAAATCPMDWSGRFDNSFEDRVAKNA